jgi:ribosomal protein S12 methylthiotransferase accessory factor
MDIVVDFPGGVRVNAQFGPFTVQTDQPAPGGTDTAPSPFDTFLASLAACAGYFVLRFCQQRDIPTDGIRVIQHSEWDSATHMVSKIKIEIQLPSNFPEKYKDAVIRSADQCTVKKHIMHPPQFEIFTVTNDAVPA